MNTKNNQEKINEIKTELEKSPLFNLSLSSKELFHSNFLYWFADNYRESFVNLLKELLKKKDFDWEEDFNKNNGNIILKREKENFDFSIWKKENGKNYPVLVIENKVKSIAYKEQLDNYVEKVKKIYVTTNSIKKVSFILLTLAPYNDDLSCSKYNVNWKIWSYGDYLKMLKKYALDENDSYKHGLIKDYISFTNNLVELTKKWLEENESKKMFIADMKMVELRIDDIRQKVIYTNFVNNLCTTLQEKGYYISRTQYKDIVSDKSLDTDKPILHVNSSYGKPGAFAEVKFATDNDFKDNKLFQNWVIQIQAGEYRIGLERFNGFEKLPKERVTNNNRGVFYRNFIDYIQETYKKIPSLLDIELDIKNGDYKIGKFVEKSGKGFLYGSKKIEQIGNIRSKDEVIDMICADLETFKKEFKLH